MVIPYINARGKFTFGAPYDTAYDMDQEYVVSSVHVIKELEDNGYDVLTYVYKNHGLDESDYGSDLDNNVPIITLRSTGNTYIYVPADKIIAIPDITGVKYQDKILAVRLGYIPVNMDLTTASDIIKNTILNYTGLVVETEAILNSAITIFSPDEDTQWLNATQSRKTESKSDYTRYMEQLTINTALTEKIAALEAYIEANLNP